MCLGVVLVCLACVSTWLPWVVGLVTEPVEKQFGLSAVYRKSDRAAGPLRERGPSPILSDVEEGGGFNEGFTTDHGYVVGVVVTPMTALAFKRGAVGDNGLKTGWVVDYFADRLSAL